MHPPLDRQHKWRRDTSWWDELEIPLDVAKDPGLFSWLDERAPDPTEHDFILYTDGSGCANGWGGYAALIQRIVYDPVTETRVIGHTDCLVTGTYGSTVQRCEMSAFLDGVHRILTDKAAEVIEAAAYDPAEKYEISKEGPLGRLLGPDRPTILWYTDRANLAKSLLFDENGDVLNSRSGSESDLWMRWSAMARYVCVTPIAVQRNTIDGQAACDGLAGIARNLMKSHMDALAGAAESIHPTDKWNLQRSQKAQF